MTQLNRETGIPVNLQNPLPVNDVSSAMDKESITGETVTLKTGAAGFTGVVSLDKKPIANLDGDRVGSFWRSEWNTVCSSKINPSITVTAVTETATAATVTLESGQLDLEELFETPSGNLEYIIEITDPSAGTLYGWIKGVAETGSSYVLDVYSEMAGSTQSWVGTLGSFTFARGTRFAIYRSQTSIAWTTGTALTREVALPADIRDLGKFLDGLSNGDYAVDYERATIYYKKATTGTSDTIAYTVLTGRAAVISGGGTTSSTKTDDAAFTVATDQVTPVGLLADDTSPDAVNEGDVGIPRMGLDRVTYVQGAIANDAADSGNPIKIGGKAFSTKPTAVTANDRVDAYFDLFGRQHVYDEGGGGVSGGGLSTYVFTPSNSFGHGTSAYGSGTTFTVSGHSFTPEAVALTKVDRFSSAGVFQESLSPAQNTITASTTAGVTTYTYSSGSFSAGDLFVVYQAGPERTVSVPNDATRSSIINRDTDKDTADTLLALTNITSSTTAYGYIDCSNYKYVVIQNETSDTTPTDTLTLTLEGTVQDDGTAAASCTYQDVTTELTGSASFVDTDCMWIIDTPVKFKYLRVKYVTNAGGANDADLTTYVIKGV